MNAVLAHVLFDHDRDGTAEEGQLTLCVHPLCIQVGQDCLVALLLEAFGRLLVHQTATSPPPSAFAICVHLAFGRLDTQGRRGVHALGECDAGRACALKDCGRQFGGIVGGSG